MSSPYAWDVVESAKRCGLLPICVDNFGGADPALDGLIDLGDLTDCSVRFTVGLSSAVHRGAAYIDLASRGFDHPSVLVDPTAIIASTASLGHGVYVNAGVVLSSRTVVGCAANINRSASLGHDNTIGWSASIGPGVTSGGHVTVGAHTLIGVGASVLPGVTIGDWCVVGAGAVIVRDIPSGSTVVGNPAMKISSRTFPELNLCPYC